MEKKIKRLDATDERQYMIHEEYEVYEKQGAPIGAATFHYHNFYEIIYVLEGTYSSMVENQTYDLKKGDFLLIDINVMHRYNQVDIEKHKDSKRIILWVTPGMLQHLSESDMDFAAYFHEGKGRVYHFPVYYEELLRGYLLKLALKEVVSEELQGSKTVADRGFLTLFFMYLCNLCAKEEYSLMEDNVTFHPLVEQVNRYVEEHIGEPILVDQLAEYIHMSKYHFLRKFKEITGVTVHGFINHKKMIRAAELLWQGKPVGTVSQETGFTEYTVFLRNFKKAFGVVPGQYLQFYGKSI